MFWRYFALESGIVGAQEHLASSADRSGATGLEIAGNWLYAAWNDNRLYRAGVDGGRVDATRTLVNEKRRRRHALVPGPSAGLFLDDRCGQRTSGAGAAHPAHVPRHPVEG